MNNCDKKIVIECRNLVKNYKIGTNTLEILKKLNFQAEQGSSISILGASGSGKTTLLNLLGMLEPPTDGELIIDGKNIQQLSAKEKSDYRNNKIGFIFQSYQLLNELNVLENIMLPALLEKSYKLKTVRQNAENLAEKVGLSHRLKHHPSEMSGGEQQRCAIARALINDPEIILADEPTGNLDKDTGNEILALFKQLQAEKSRTIITITHSDYVASLSDSTYILDNGVLCHQRTS